MKGKRNSPATKTLDQAKIPEELEEGCQCGKTFN
jgi:hypothetical protein